MLCTLWYLFKKFVLLTVKRKKNQSRQTEVNINQEYKKLEQFILRNHDEYPQQS